MTRNGKIARLPQPVREQINRRLDNGQEGKQIAEWLNTLPEVAALMAAEFDGQPINENNLSNWKLGGYRDWEAQQEALEAARQFNSDAIELSRAAPGAKISLAVPGAQLADQLALCLTARLAAALRKSPSGEDDPAAQLDRLRQLCATIARLRKGDHSAEWLRIERGKLELERKKYKDAVAARKEELKDLENPGAKAITKEAWEQLEKDLHLL